MVYSFMLPTTPPFGHPSSPEEGKLRYLMHWMVCLEINLHSRIHFHAVVFCLHGTVFRALVVA